MADETQPKPNQVADFLRKWGPLVMLAVVLAGQFGWITPQQADAIKQVLPILTAETKKAVEEQAVEARKKADDNNQQLDQIAQLIKQLVDNLTPKPAPAPTPKPDDKTEPTPKSFGIAIYDETGKVIPSFNVESGQLFRVSATGASGDIAWQPVKHGAVKIVASSDCKEWFGYLEPGQWVDFGLTDYAAKAQTSQRITCNQGPQPPPVPDVVPGPKPPEPPKPVEQKKLTLAVVHDTKITPETAIVLNATDVWNSFISDYGCDWIIYHVDDSTAEGIRAKSDLNGVAPPALIAYDKATGNHLQTVELPKSVSSLKSVVRGMVGVK